MKQGPERRRGLVERLEGWSGLQLFAGGALATLGLIAVRLNLTPVDFLLPLAAPALFVAWVGGRVVGAAVALIGPPILWGLAEFAGEAVPQGWTAVWEVGSDMFILTGIAVFVGYYRSRLREEERQAATDALTELPNRGAFIERLEDEIARSGRYGYAFTLVFLDLDGFKEVNDERGHDEGDVVLGRVADGMRQSTRQTDDLGRLGGDEFAALLPFTTVGPAQSVIDKLQRNLGEEMERGNWAVTFSIGAVTFEGPVEDARRALQVADEAMYHVKHGGKDGVHHVVWDGEHAVS